MRTKTAETADSIVSSPDRSLNENTRTSHDSYLLFAEKQSVNTRPRRWLETERYGRRVPYHHRPSRRRVGGTSTLAPQAVDKQTADDLDDTALVAGYP